MTRPQANILVVDDDLEFLQELIPVLNKVYNVNPCTSIEKARTYLTERSFDLLLIDLVFGFDATVTAGIDFIIEVKQQFSRLPMIAITQYGRPDNLINAMKAGAQTVLLKDGWNGLRWKEAIDEELKKAAALPAQNQVENIISTPGTGQLAAKAKLSKQASDQETHPFLGDDPAVEKIRHELQELSGEPDITVLLLGETGVGKEVAARYLHSHGFRSKQPFRAVHMVAHTQEVLESELFGHKKGSFTGATADRVGKFAEADGGVLFLDEIGEINTLVQQKLLRFLEEKVITPIGGKEHTVDVQIVAATNRDLKAEVQAGRFREDLYFRLHDFPIRIPPLRNRKGDIDIIANHYLRSREADRTVFNDEVWERFYNYHWPGNVREMVNLIKRLLVKKKVAKAEVLDISYLPQEMRQPYTENSTKTEHFQTPPLEHNLLSHYLKEGTLEEQTAFNELSEIEKALNTLKRKGLVVKELGFKNLDQLRYRVEKYYGDYPHLFSNFPTTKEKYKLYPNE